jgi:hypothetical protein
MKIHLKFNHDAETVLDSIDCPFTSDEVTDQLNDVMDKFMSDEKYQDKSHLAELIHNDLDYSVILFLALIHTIQKMEKKAIKQMLRKMLDEDI